MNVLEYLWRSSQKNLVLVQCWVMLTVEFFYLTSCFLVVFLEAQMTREEEFHVKSKSLLHFDS